MWYLIIGSFFIGILCIFFARKLAILFKFYSHSCAPRFDNRKIPYLGGLGIFIALWAVISIKGVFFEHVWFSLFLSSLAIFIFALIDDLIEMTPIMKILTQCFAILIWIICGYHTKIYFLPVWANIILTFIWFLLIINAINLLDILDGLAGVISCICVGSFLYIAYVQGNVSVTMLNCIFLGVLLAFLVFNLPPAKIFMGDAGSQLIGFVLAAVSILLSYAPSEPRFYKIIIPVFVLAVPLLDMFFVVITRVINKKPLHIKSNDHFVLRLLNSGFGLWEILCIMIGFTLLFSFISIVIEKSDLDVMLLSIGVGIILMFIVVIFGINKLQKKKP